MKYGFARLPVLFAFLAAPAIQAQNTVVTFDNGWEGWIANIATAQIESDGGNPGANARYVVNLASGIAITTDAHEDFLGNHGTHGAVTVGMDVKAESITDLNGPISTDLTVEFRNYTMAGTGGKPYVSVWFNLGQIDSGQDWTSYAATFDPASTTLPDGWHGTGATDPVTFEPMLPEGISFADVMANVEEVSFGTLVPGHAFLMANYDVRLDNLRIDKSEGESPFPRYEIVDLGDFGGELANAFDINDNGDVVGTAENPSLMGLPFLSRGGGELIYLGSLTPDIPFGGGDGKAISNNGYVVGYSSAPFPGGGSTSQAFLWSESNGMINLNPDPNFASTAWDVNSSGQVVGDKSGPNGGSFFWTEQTGMRIIGLPNGSSGFALGINENGQVCGHQWINNFASHAAWVYDNATDTYRQLPGLDGNRSSVRDINDSGDVVGVSERQNFQIRPVLWTPDGDLIDLGFLPVPDFTQGEAYAINNNRWIVGTDWYDGIGVQNKGWLWIDGKKVELRSLIDDPAQLAAWSDLTHPFSINNRGEITGVGIRDDIPGRAFLMRPIADKIFGSGFEADPVGH